MRVQYLGLFIKGGINEGVRMNWKVFSVEVFVVLASYLILTLPVTSATNIRIIYYGSERNVSYNPENLVSKVIYPDEVANTVSVSIINAGSDVIETVYLYRCGDYSPTDCIGHGSYESQDAGFSREYDWSELADQTLDFPQTANIMTLVKFVDPFGGKWAGYWDTVTKEYSGSGFSVSAHRLDNMDLYVKTYGFQDLIYNFIRDRDMIPFNPNWVEKAVFPPEMTKLYELGMNSPSDITPENHSGNVITGIDKDFSFVFAEGSIMNPVVFNMNPSYTCGQFGCESGLGETSGNCCYDCDCPSGQYCDRDRGCQSEGGITLSLSGTPYTVVSNCNVEHHLSIAVELDNPPRGFSITNMSYILNGTDSYTVSCSGGVGTNYIYTCNITVPRAVHCIEGEFILTPNSINFVISYPDGPNTVSKTLSASFPDITIGSWTCGQLGCEESLGEDYSNCCYDCNNCPGGQYCDFVTGQPSTSICKLMPDNSNLRILDVDPTHFSSSDGSEDVDFVAQITNKPQGMFTPPADCSIDCTPNCTASCFVSCSSVSSSDPSVYNSTCMLSFVISNYNMHRDYTLYPVLNYTMTFNNGTGPQITKTLSTGVGGITIGIHYCGDLSCTPDESQSTCCYDCDCPGGQYCDTMGTTDHRLDSCKPLNLINMTKVDIGSTNLTDSSIEHRLNVTLRVDSKPSGASLSAVCGFNSSVSDVACSAECGEINENDAVCQVIIPAINYSETGFYDPVARMITLPQNVMDVNLGFNDGPNVSSMDFSFSLPDITIDVVYHCGNGVCELDLGESASSCCLDCLCEDDPGFGSDYWCYTGRRANGECIKTSDVQLEIVGFYPDPVECTIFELEGECVFVQAVDVGVHIFNAASDLEVLSGFYTYDNEDYSLSCFATPFNQTENHICSFVIPHPEGSDEGTINKDFGLTLTVKYSADPQTRIQNISANSMFTIQKLKSEALKTCEEEMAHLDDKIAGLEKDEDTVKMWITIFWGLSIIFWILCIWYEWCCELAFWLTCIAICLTAVLLPQIEKIKNEIKSLETQRDNMCRASDFGGLRSGADESLNIGNTVVSLILGILCIICLWEAMGGMGGGEEAAAAEGGGSLDVSGATWQSDPSWAGGGYWETASGSRFSATTAGVKPAPVAP